MNVTNWRMRAHSRLLGTLGFMLPHVWLRLKTAQFVPTMLYAQGYSVGLGFPIGTFDLYVMSTKKLIWFGTCATLLAAALLAAAIHALSTRSGPPGAVRALERFADKAKQEVDPHVLQNWAVSLLERYPEESYRQISPNEIPGFLSNFGPPRATISLDAQTDERIVVVVYGSGFAHWGFMIGPKDMIPLRDNGRYLIEWISGVYCFHGKPS